MQSGARLFILQRRQIVTAVLDALLHGIPVLVVEVIEDGPSRRYTRHERLNPVWVRVSLLRGQPSELPMASPARHFDAVTDEERLLDVVRALVSELGHQPALASVGPAANLERELGLGSLERVELLLRIEQAFGTRLDDQVLAEADTVQDLISALGAVNGLPAVAPTRAGVATRAPEISSRGIADGLPTAQTIQ